MTKVLGILNKLGESEFVKNLVRKNTYITDVNCRCEIKEKSNKNFLHGQNCFCKLDYNLFGKIQEIKTHLTQPTFNIRLEITPNKFTEFAETKSLV